MESILFKIKNWIENIWEFLEYENFIRPLLVIIIIVAISSLSLSLVEPNLS